jgi:hypothetical protein
MSRNKPCLPFPAMAVGSSGQVAAGGTDGLLLKQ